ncbi:MAG: hypothetical protein K2W96_13375 [Gemmataceae bacterium]|nr:hypothetical protein [Gemmataceae bacterium]
MAESRTLPPKKAGKEKLEGMKASKTVRGGSPNRASLFRDGKKHVLLQDLSQPFGMALSGARLCVGVTDGVLSFPYKEGDTRITAKPLRIMPLPAGGYNNPWTRNLLFDKKGEKPYVTVGSGSNVGENGIENELRTYRSM